jgi:hypothetical protein
LLTAVAVADTQKTTETMETAEAWVKVTQTKTVADLVAVADLTLDNPTVEAVAVVEQELQVDQQDAQQQQTELDHLVAWAVMDLDLEHLVVHKEHLTTGLHGLVLEEWAEMVNTELQAEAAEVDQLAEEVLVAVAQEDHKQLITQVDRAWMELVQAEAEIITQVEMVKREVLA